MGILGKIVGGAIGFAIGGPLGAVVGATFGHAFDAGGGTYIEHQTAGVSPGEQAQATFFIAAFSMLAKLVRADGQVTREELESVEKFMVYDLNLDPQSRQAAMNIFNTAAASPQRFEDFASQFYHSFRNQPQLLDMMIDIMLRVALADGRISPPEEQLIQTAASLFQMGDERYRAIKSRYQKETDRYYAVLGISSSASDEEIKKQYRQQVREYHPDTIASKGLPEEFTKFAEDKFREIQEAYEAIRKERGIR